MTWCTYYLQTNVFSSYSVKTKRNGQTDRRRHFNISRPGPLARWDINKKEFT